MHNLSISTNMCFIFITWNIVNLTKLSVIKISHLIAHKACWNLCQISILNTFLKSQFVTWTLTPPKNHVKNFENQMQKASIQTPIQDTTFHHYTSFTKIFILSETQTNLSQYVPNFLPLLIWTFWPKKLKNLNFTFSFLVHYLYPNWTSKAQKILNWPSSWPWNRCTHTLVGAAYGWFVWVAFCLGHSKIELP